MSPSERPQAKRVVVVFTDGKSTSPIENLRAVGKMSKEDGVQVIAVGIGPDADNNEMEAIASSGNDVVNASIGDKTEDTMKKIMDKVFGKKLGAWDLLFYYFSKVSTFIQFLSKILTIVQKKID